MENIRSKLNEMDLPRLLNAPVDIRVRRPKVTIVMLHGIGNSAAGWEILRDKMPLDARIIAIDLLGFGNSPKPTNVSYNLRLQARSIAATLLRMRITTRVIIVGHSMGALIATELAKRYPIFIGGLVLCGPPIYRPHDELPEMTPRAERMLRRIYTTAVKELQQKPDRYIALARRATRVHLAPETFSITKETVVPYVTALQTGIMRQSTFRDIQKLKIPVKIIYGTLDPFVVPKNFKYLARENTNISIKSIIAGHEVRRAFVKPIIEALDQISEQMK